MKVLDEEVGEEPVPFSVWSVSYTHLDVYKRQVLNRKNI